MIKLAFICAILTLSAGCEAKSTESPARQPDPPIRAIDGRQAPKAMKIQLLGDAVVFPLGTVKIRDSLAKWQKVIPGKARCSESQTPPIICTWDILGLEIATDDSMKKVNSFRLYLNPPPEDYLQPLPKNNPDGTPDLTLPRPPTSLYAGQLKFDGVDVTSTTSYSAIGPRLASERNVRCGLRDCASPHGMFGANTKLFFRLTGRRSENVIQEFSIEWVDYGTEDLTK